MFRNRSYVSVSTSYQIGYYQDGAHCVDTKNHVENHCKGSGRWRLTMQQYIATHLPIRTQRGSMELSSSARRASDHRNHDRMRDTRLRR